MKAKFLLTIFLSTIAFGFACRTSNVAANDVAEASTQDFKATSTPTPLQLTAEQIERKNEIEQKMLRGEYLHDGPLELEEIGDIDSVPALLVVLRENPSKPNGTMVCTRAHGLIALQKITGEYPGPRTEDWEEWWNNRQANK